MENWNFRAAGNNNCLQYSADVQKKAASKMNLLFQIIIGYFTLYAVIWMHEVGHSYFYWRFGCKDNFLRVTVKPTLFFSTPAPVNEEKCESLSSVQNIVIGYGGILVNLLSALLSLALIKWIRIPNIFLLLFLWAFCTLHTAEIVSYMFIGNIYPVSDMQSISDENPKLRIVNFVIGVFLSAFYIVLLFEIPEPIRIITLVFNGISLISMGVGRIVFTYRAQKQQP